MQNAQDVRQKIQFYPTFNLQQATTDNKQRDYIASMKAIKPKEFNPLVI